MSHTIALCSAIALPEGTVPDWVHLLPADTVQTADGRGPYTVPDAQAVISMSIAAGKLPLDENHATDLAAPKGGAAPARGWIVELQQRPDGIWGRVEWTAIGRRMMEEREYRGVSPVIAHGKDKVISAILRASLTNTPNLTGLTSLHSKDATKLTKDEVIDNARKLIERLKEHFAHEGTSPALQSGSAAAALHSRRSIGSDGFDQTDRDVIRALGIDPAAYLANRAGNLSGLTSLHSQDATKPIEGQLDAEDLEMIRKLGLDPDQYLAQKNAAEAKEKDAQKVALQSAGRIDADGLDAVDRDLIRRLGIDRAAYIETRGH